VIQQLKERQRLGLTRLVPACLFDPAGVLPVVRSATGAVASKT